MKLIYIANIRLPTEKAHGLQIMKMCEAFANYGLPRMNATDKHGLLYKDITDKIRKAIFKVYNSLGNGHKEAVCQRSLEEEFRKEGLKFENQKHLSVYYDGKKVGDYIPDFVVENKVIVEIKATKFLTKDDRQQILYYLKGSGYRLALLVNFGSRNLQIKRIVWFPPNEYQKNPWPSVVKNNPRQSEASPKNPWLSAVNNHNPRISVELIIPRRFNWIKKDPFDYYGIDTTDNHGFNNRLPRIDTTDNHRLNQWKSVVLNPRKSEPFKIKRLPCLDLIPLDKYLGNLGLWIESFTFLISAFFYLLFKKADFFYTRDKEILPLILIKKSFIYEAHGFPKNYFLYSPFLKKLKGIIVITQKLKELFVEKGIPENKISVAPDAVDLGKFDIKISKEEARKKLNLPQDKILLGYVGMLKTMGMEKGIDIAIESLKFLDDNVNLILVGGSEDEIEFYKKLSRDLHLEGRVVFICRVKHQLVPFYLKAFDVLIAPFPDNEHYRLYMSPLKIFEYMASKRPIVASDLPSIREILYENKRITTDEEPRIATEKKQSGVKSNAILVKPDDPESLTEGIKKVLEDENLAEKISNQAFLDVQQYTWQKRAKKILNFIQNAK